MSTERITKRRRLSPPSEDKGQNSISKRKITSKKSLSISVSKTTNSIENIQSSQSTTVEEGLPAVKGLDSSDASIRRKTLTTILNHLTKRSALHPLSKTQCLQLWRGFHVIVYMHDSRNMISVQNLLHEIAGTFTTISAKDDIVTETSSQWLKPYHEAFWETMVREWSGIDSHRMNKYLLLIRLVMRQLFGISVALIEGEIFPEKATSKATSILETLSTVGPLNSKDLKIPNGLRLHLLDVWTDEIRNALTPAEKQEQECKEELSNETAVQFVTDTFREPLSNIAASTSGAPKAVRIRAKDTLTDLDEKLSALKEGAEEGGDDLQNDSA